MIIRKLDATHDWTFGKGQADYATGEDAVNENLQTRLLSWVGDCFFGVPDFVDWRSRLDVGQKDALIDELKSVILNSFGVVGVNSVQSSFDGNTRAIIIEYDIQTIYSPSFQGQIRQGAGTIG